MVRILAIADEIDQALYGGAVRGVQADVVVACGDLPFDYLEYIVTMVNAPLVFVPGNHDPDLQRKLDPMDAGEFATPFWFARGRGERPGPPGCVNLDARVIDVAGLRMAGLGGSMRYKPGPNQYTEREMRRRAFGLELRGRWRKLRDNKGVDLLVTHAPPLGIGDGDDPPHKGFESFHRLIAALSPKMMLHGHVHPYGRVAPRQRLADTLVVNVVGRTVLELAA